MRRRCGRVGQAVEKRRYLLLLAIAVTASSVYAVSRPAPAAGVVATIGDKTITESELEELAKDRLARLRSEEYQIKRQVLEEYITRRLMEQEAKARGVSVEQLQKVEIDDKVMPVTEEQKRAVYESNPQSFQGKSEADAVALIEANLRRIRLAEARGKLLSALRAKTPVKIVLEPPRLAVPASDDPATGPEGAGVTIVEFSDFQCPACGHAFPTVKRLLEQYAGKVRLIFRDFPLPIHPQAPKAAEAGNCAHEQGKFWAMHDWMFTNQQKLAVPDLKAAAAGLGLDTAKFNACLDSGRYASEWQEDVAEGKRYGVSSTPTFLINGRMLSGARPYQAFTEMIEEELSRAKSN